MAEGTEIFARDGIYKDLRGGGRGISAQLSQVSAGLKARPDLFIGSRKNVGKTKLAEGYSFTGGAGKQLVDTITYRGSGSYSGGTFNVYKDAPKPTPAPTPAATPEPTPAATTPEPPQPQVPDYGQQISDAMAAADARMADLMNQFKIQQAAAEERQRLAAEAQRQQMLTMARRDRAAGRAPNLQIRGAGETPTTAGTQGFRRRKDQFRITPFQGIGGIMSSVGQVAQGAANQMVNI